MEKRKTETENTEEARPLPASENLPKTTGEKWFGRLRFVAGEGIILALTAALAYIAQYGKDTYAGIPNYLQRFQKWMTNQLLNNPALPLRDKGDYGPRLAHIIAGTTVLMHGGNAFVPVMQMIEERKEAIVTYFNKKLAPDEVESGQKRVRAEPEQTWGDLIKSRFIAWFVVFSSLVGADKIFGRGKSGDYHFDKFEHGFGKWLAGLTKNGRQAIEANTLKNNNTYRFGKILALDIYATAAALLIWISTSKFFAMMRSKKSLKNTAEAADPIIEAARELSNEENETREQKPVPRKNAQEKILAEGRKNPRQWAENNLDNANLAHAF